MRINFALQNIFSNPRKSALSLAGIGVAVLLIFMQLGFRGAVENTATNIYGKLDFDILLRSRDYLHFVDANQVDNLFLEEVFGLDGVQSVQHLRVSLVNWRNPHGEMKGILLLGVDPLDSPFRDARVDSQFHRLTSDGALLIDQQSHREFGPANGRRFTDQDVGRSVEVADQRFQVVGLFEMGAGLAANGAAIVSDKSFEGLVPTSRDSQVTLGLVKLTNPRRSRQFADKLQERFALDNGADSSIEVLTRNEVIQKELERWIGETPIGFIFTLGVMISLVVGAAIVYMVLGNDVSNRLHEYATLRAMGYSSSYLGMTVLKQAMYLALFSFVPALVLAFVLYAITGWFANIAMEMTLTRVVVVFLLTLVMCGISGTLALKKLWQAEPAELF
jgi:putative ABC transport system permease protein